jgi:hypothetical protein
MSDKKQPLVAVCLPTGHVVTAKTAVCLGLLMHHSARLLPQMAIVPAEGCYIAQSRNQIAKMALDGGADALLWIDSDQTFPPNGLLRLLDQNLPFVGATYRMRNPPHPYTLKLADKSDMANRLPRVSFLPGGFCLIRREVYEAMPFPWYRADYDLDPDQPGVFIGEDVFFCGHARAANFEIHCDLTLTREIGHVVEIDLRAGSP